MSKLFRGRYRKTIGITTGLMDTHYDYTLSRAVRKAALERDINLLILVCGSMERNLNHKYEYQNNIMYYMLSPDSVDGLILLPSIVYNYSEKSQFEKLLSHYHGLPLITLSEYVDGFPGIIVDNSSGVRELVNHLHGEHGKRHFSFVGGPQNNSEAQARLDGFLQGMNDIGLKPSPHDILPGDFWTTGGAQAVKIIESSGRPWPEVIVCSNDYTAYGVYEELKKRNITVPNDIAVTGFDNMQAARYSFPPLTSIEQPLEAMAAKAVELLELMLDGKEVPTKTVMPTRAVYRWSTGCSRWNRNCSGLRRNAASDQSPYIRFRNPHLRSGVVKWVNALRHADTQDESSTYTLIMEFTNLLYLTVSSHEDLNTWDDFLFEINSMLQRRKKEVNHFTTSLFSRLAEIRELCLGLHASRTSTYALAQSKVIQRILSVFTRKELSQEIKTQLPKLEIQSFFMTIYPLAFSHAIHETWEIPKLSRFFCGYCRDKPIPVPTNDAFRTSTLLPDFVQLPDEPMAFVMMAASFRDMHYGYILMEASVDDEQVYANLATQISTAYRGILVFNEKERKTYQLRSVLDQLKESNRRLEELSTRDPLTDAYNRRGFISLGEKYHQSALRNGTDYALFYADLDGLKEINDTWGHNEGDEAIKTFGDILLNTFRVADIIARLGGDEFTVCTANTGPDSTTVIQKRLQKAVDSFNASSSKPWKLSFSIGHVVHSEQEGLSFMEKLSLADTRLYENKRRKKSGYTTSASNG